MKLNLKNKQMTQKKFKDVLILKKYPDTLMKIGIIYRRKRPKKTYESYEKAAKLGKGDAFFCLGVFCQDGFRTTKNND